MCTTYLACHTINQLKENNIRISGYPRLIRLNPFAKFKTRGNGGISFKIAIDEESEENSNGVFHENSEEKMTKIQLAKKIILKNIEDLSQMSHENTNPGVVFYEGEITEAMKNYAMKAIYSIISIKEAEKIVNKIGAEVHKFKKGRGIIGSLAAIACPLEDYTYELLTYRMKENYGKKRNIDKLSVIEMDRKTFPETFENIDYNNEYIAIEPKTPCPILFGIRGESPDILKTAKNIIKANETIQTSCIFKTNQHTDMHLQKIANINDMEEYGSYIVSGTIIKEPHIIEGGHVFFSLKDESGEIEAAAYEPTKNFRKVIKKLLISDQVQLFGGIGCGGTFNIEKIKILSLAKKQEFKNPMCQCGKRMTSAGLNKGFKCRKCGHKLPNGKKIAIEEKRDLIENKFYETPVSARRHLSKPISRMNK
ncbi:MAG: tRNA(Ile)(2)-agmatinylcytidine synthase [Methanobacteriaceae archaeon]|jgi:tRNA(Ile2)-agmatinylcytidine synthase|nr:tRNA(Ile)(2)-agmatinylcytidine synthase [Candidatus Methanorudis spinitermitis]